MADKNYDILDDKGNVKASNQPAPITVSGLSANTTYSGWQARYTGEKIMQTLASFTTKAAEAALAKPSAPTVTVTAGDGSADYTITDANISKEQVSSLKVLYQADGASDWTTVNIDDPTKLTGTVKSLTNGTAYSFKAIATNASGDSADSTVVKVTPAAPAAPASNGTSK